MKHEQGIDSGWPMATLDALVDAMRRTHGRDLSQFDASFLTKSIEKRLAATSCDTAAAYLERLAEDGAEAEALCDSLRIGFSEFFRDPLVFALLELVVLPALVQKKSGGPEIRIWSAGCAAGQEAYSVAILLDELAAGRERPIPVRIFATDVSEADLAVARKGVYDRAAVQKVGLRHLRGYFSMKNESYVVAPRLRDRVDFSTYDLLDGRSVCPPVSLYGDFDLIFCSNLLFYYRSEIRRQILDKVCRALSPDGYFVTGEAERDIVAKHDGLRAVAPPAAVFQKRLHHG